MDDEPAGHFTRDDLRVLSQALNEVLHGPEAIEDWEFQTRMGATREEALDLLDRIGRLLRDWPRNSLD